MIYPAYFFWIGTIYLLILTWQDYKKKMLVDDRLNYFMMGVTFSLLSHVQRSFWYIILILILFYALAYYLKKYKLIGEADVNTLLWIFYGLSILAPYYAFWFAGIFITLTLIYFGAKRWIFKNKEYTPFYGVILISFVALATIFKLF